MALSNARHFPFRRIERNMREQAEEVIWHQAQLCTCGVIQETQGRTRSSVNCTLCGGWGVYYHDPKHILAIVSQYDVKKNLLDMAISQPGDLMLAPLPRSGIWLADYDKITLPYFEDGEVYQGEAVSRAVVGSNDTTRFSIVAVDYCSSVVLPGTETVYVYGIDFTVTPETNTITWISSNRPKPGQVYAIRYRTRWDWIAFNPPNARYARGTDIGQRVLLRRREFVVKQSTA